MTDRQDLVLVVDDDLAVRESLKFVLEVEGLVVHSFAGGTELLAHPALREACCIILDYRMPVMDGFLVISRLAAENVKVPVILMTAHATNLIRYRATKAGVCYVLEKPLLDGALVDSIHAILAARPPP